MFGKVCVTRTAGRLGLDGVALVAEVCRERCAGFVSGRVVKPPPVPRPDKTPAIRFPVMSIEFS